jgi:hypothetical protein
MKRGEVGQNLIEQDISGLQYTKTTSAAVFGNTAWNGIDRYLGVLPNGAADQKALPLTDETGLSHLKAIFGAATYPSLVQARDDMIAALAFDQEGNPRSATSPNFGAVEIVKDIAPEATVVLSIDPPNGSKLGNTVKLTATVIGSDEPPVGNVVFSRGSTTMGSVPVTEGTAELTTTEIPVGTHSIVARYSGDSTYAEAQSAPISYTIIPNDDSVGYEWNLGFEDYPFTGTSRANAAFSKSSEMPRSGDYALKLDRHSAKEVYGMLNDGAKPLTLVHGDY